MTRREKIDKLIGLAKLATSSKNTIKTFILVVDALDCWDEAINELSEQEYNHAKLNDYIYEIAVKDRDEKG